MYLVWKRLTSQGLLVSYLLNPPCQTGVVDGVVKGIPFSSTTDSMTSVNASTFVIYSPLPTYTLAMSPSTDPSFVSLWFRVEVRCILCGFSPFKIRVYTPVSKIFRYPFVHDVFLVFEESYN